MYYRRRKIKNLDPQKEEILFGLDKHYNYWKYPRKNQMDRLKHV